MSLEKWAEEEIKIACTNENPDWDGKSFDYGCSIYMSALKAFKSILEDGHSGSSIQFTKQILCRLIDGKPLTPIEDDEDNWNNREDRDSNSGYVCYQNKRMSSLFKYVYDDGTIKYSDVDRVVLIEPNGLGWHNGLASRIVDEMFPISMPYSPADKAYEVYVEDWLFDANNGDYDTRCFEYMIKPDGTKVDIGRYFAEKNRKFVEISREEYEERKENRVR